MQTHVGRQPQFQQPFAEFLGDHRRAPVGHQRAEQPPLLNPLRMGLDAGGQVVRSRTMLTAVAIGRPDRVGIDNAVGHG